MKVIRGLKDLYKTLSWYNRLKLRQANCKAFLVGCLLLGCAGVAEAVTPPDNLALGIVAEQTRGSIDEFRVIASVVYNRLKNSHNCGLVALKRSNLKGFVADNVRFIQAKYGYNPLELANQAIKEVFVDGYDYSEGATHYEHTQQYPQPYWAKSMTLVKVLYPGTSKELTLWR